MPFFSESIDFKLKKWYRIVVSIDDFLLKLENGGN